MGFLHGLLVITFVHLLAAASPGPDFVLVSQQSLAHGRKTGILCSLGIAFGLSVHLTYSALGLAALIASSTSILLGIKLLGGCYLLFLGIKGLGARPETVSLDLPVSLSGASVSRTVGKGFLCNVLNPKAPVYFVSLFTIVLSPSMPPIYLAVYGIWIMMLQFCWFSAVAILLSSPPVVQRFTQCGHYLNRVMGGAMVVLGVKVLTSHTG